MMTQRLAMVIFFAMIMSVPVFAQNEEQPEAAAAPVVTAPTETTITPTPAVAPTTSTVTHTPRHNFQNNNTGSSVTATPLTPEQQQAADARKSRRDAWVKAHPEVAKQAADSKHKEEMLARREAWKKANPDIMVKMAADKAARQAAMNSGHQAIGSSSTTNPTTTSVPSTQENAQ